MKRLQTATIPNSRVGRACLAVLTLAAGFRLLGEQGARIGSWLTFPVELRWILGAAALVLFLLPQSSDRPNPRPFLAVLVLLALTAWPLRSWRAGIVTPTPQLVVELSRASDPDRIVEKTLLLDSLDLDDRRYLQRLTGRRRDIALEINGYLLAPQDGEYRFTIDCDDACAIRIDGTERIPLTDSASVTTDLDSGYHRLTIHYEQRQGPGFLRIHWNRPAPIELLRLEHYLSGRSGDRLVDRRLTKKARLAAISCVGGLVWWTLLLGLLLRIGETRTTWKQRLTAEPAARWAPRIAALVLIGYGALLRLDAFWVHSHLATESEAVVAMHQSLHPILPNYSLFNPNHAPDDPYRADVRSYLDRASSMGIGNFYHAHFREPFYVALVKIFVIALGGRELGILIQSLFFSVAILPLVFLLAARLANRWWALATLVPLVLHEWLILEAPTGYRMSAYSFFLLLYFGWLFLGRDRRWWADGITAGFLGGMVSLIRLSGLSLVLPLFLLKGWEKRKTGGCKYAAATLITLVVLVGPFLVNCYREHGDPFYSVSFHTQFWLETEHRGEAVSSPVNLYQYFLDFHGLSELSRGTFLGLTLLPLRTFWNGLAHFPWLSAMVIGAGMAGLAWSPWCQRGFLPLAYFGHLLPFAYIQNFPSGEMPRFVMPAYFFFVLAAGWTGYRVAQNRRRKPS